MSQENVEIVRRIYQDGWFDQQPDQVLALAAPDVEYVNPPEAVDAGVRRGTAEVARAFHNISESFDSFRHELHELFDGGDSVVAWVSFCTRSAGSETEVVQKEAHTWTLRSGRIVRFEWGRDLKAALEAAGVRSR
jgi:ketosteroid isomerase-like protein